jgi:RNase P subunit RPR2
MEFTMTVTYPRSRIQSAGHCEVCKGPKGFMKDAGRLRLEDAEGNPVELMRWTCQKCGYTMLFDLAVPRAVPLSSTLSI